MKKVVIKAGYPLIDLHRHLEGCVRPATIVELGRQHRLPLPAYTVEELLPHIQTLSPVADLMTYIAKFDLMQWSMVDYAAIRRITREALEDAHREGLDYVELRFSPVFMAEKHRLDLDGVVEAVGDGLAEARASVPIKAKLIGIMSRTYGPESCWQELKAIVRGRGRGVVAVDVAGDEIGYPARLFAAHFRYAREAGMHVTVHAGESDGVDQVRQAIGELGAERLGHAVHAVDDPAVLDLIAERSIGIESCLTSNIHTRAVRGYAAHPLPAFLRRGLLATLNTDATVLNGIDLPAEYRSAEEDLGLAMDDLARLRSNALRVAFLSEEERADLMRDAASRALKLHTPGKQDDAPAQSS